MKINNPIIILPISDTNSWSSTGEGSRSLRKKTESVNTECMKNTLGWNTIIHMEIRKSFRRVTIISILVSAHLHTHLVLVWLHEESRDYLNPVGVLRKPFVEMTPVAGT